ncbi:MAG: helix-turn-helix transcriptional regulator [Clostridia bacterium]|nr:helix-turn-helix transcriptional regulator [Clostridia bacterium]
MSKIFSERLKYLRDEKGLSQSALAKEIGASQKAIDFWEKGINEPKIVYVTNICKFFDVSPNWILGFED